MKPITVKKIFRILHLWLGLLSGLVVFIVCSCAAIWAFSPEIEDLFQTWRHVPRQERPFLPVTALKEIAAQQLPGREERRIGFYGREGAALVDFWDDGLSYRYAIFIDPYSGKVLKIRDEKHAFFSVVLEGHMELWLGEVGGVIVKWATLIFLIMLISGIVLWWPRNKAARKQRFTIKTGSSPKRMNYDLHNVLGFYAAWILVFAVITAMVWTFEWVRDAEYWIGSGGKPALEYPNPVARAEDGPAGGHGSVKGIDSIFTIQTGKYSSPWLAVLSLAATDSSAYIISVYPRKNYYESDNYYYNRHSLREMPVASFGKYKDANGGEKLSRMNYDIHIGNILGLAGRIAMFLAVLIGASLPVTGFCIWWGRNKRSHTARV